MINKQRGEIATFLTLVSVGLMVIGMMTGSYLTQRETKTVGRAAVSCDDPKWYCKFTQADGSVVEECASPDARDMFSKVWCDPADRWRYEAAVSTARCGGKESRQIPASGSCTATPIPQPTGGGCPPGQWECRYDEGGGRIHQNCSYDNIQDQFRNIWCKPEQRWKWEDAGNTARCAGEESYKLSDVGGDCSKTPTPKPTSIPPVQPTNPIPTATSVPGQTGTPGGPYKCEDLTQYTLRDCRITMNGPCTYGAWKYDCVSNPGANCNWNDSGVGIPYWCDGNKWYLMNNAGECTTACYKGGPNVTQAPNPTKAPNPGGFHLTSDIIAKREGVNIKFEFNITFNSDGCDGDVTLYKDGAGPIAGPNGWRGPGGFTYYPQWTQSPTLARGNSATVNYEGRVDRCPRSPTTLKDSISCTLSVDANGNPSITGAGCNFANKADFPAATPPVIPTSATGCNLPRTTDFKKECTDCIYTGDKGWIDTLKSKADSSNKCSLEEVVEFWCSGGMENGQLDNINLIGKKECTERYIDKNSRSYRSCADLCIAQAIPPTSPPDAPTLTPVITYGPGTPSPVPPTPTYGPTLPLRATPVISPTPTPVGKALTPNKKITLKYIVQNYDCAAGGLCRHDMKESNVILEVNGFSPIKATLTKQDYTGPGFGYAVFSKDIDVEIPKEYKATVSVNYTDKNYPGKMCTHSETNVPSKVIDSNISEWKIDGGLDPARDCGGSAPVAGHQIAFKYMVQNVDCAWFGLCRHEMIDSAVWLTAGNTTRREDLPRDAYAGPGFGFVGFSKNIINLEVPQTYTAKLRVRYKDKNYAGKICTHVETNVPTKDINSTVTEWKVDGGLDPATDCDPSKTPPELQGSSNQAFLSAIDRYKNGEISSQEISSFISQLSRTPSLQVQYCNAPAGECESPTYPITEEN